MDNETTNPRGRPALSFTDDEKKAIVESYEVTGSLSAVAIEMGLKVNTLWHRIYGHEKNGIVYPGDKDLIERLKAAKGVAINTLRLNSFRAANGHVKKVKRQVVSPNGKTVEVVEEKYYPPDSKFAAMVSYWLKAGLNPAEKSDGQADEKSSLEIVYEN
jgi:transposase-like protein